MNQNLRRWGLAKSASLSTIQRKKSELPGTLLAAAAAVAMHTAVPPCGRHSRSAVPAGVAAGCYHYKPPAIFISSKQTPSSPLNGYKMLCKSQAFPNMGKTQWAKPCALCPHRDDMCRDTGKGWGAFPAAGGLGGAGWATEDVSLCR